MITLIEPIQYIVSAFNRINYKISSDEVLQDGFKYVVKVFDANDLLISTIYYDAEAVYDSPLEFDISNFVNTRFQYQDSIMQEMALVSLPTYSYKYRLKCYEYYLNDLGVYAIDVASEVVSEWKIAVPLSIPLIELSNFYTNEYPYKFTDVCDESGGNLKPLTDWEYQKLRLTDLYTICCYSLDNRPIISFIMRAYTGESYTDLEYVTYGIDESLYVLGVTPINFGNPDKIEIFVKFSSGACGDSYIKLVQTLYIQPCSKYEPVRLMYLGKYGTMEYMNFDLVSRQSFDIDRKKYQRDYTGDLLRPLINNMQNITPIYYTGEKEKWKLTSDYLTNEQSHLLRYLYSSPLVYMVMPNGQYVNVNIVPNTYEVKNSTIDKLFNLDLDIEIPVLNTRQSI